MNLINLKSINYFSYICTIIFNISVWIKNYYNYTYNILNIVVDYLYFYKTK